MEGEGVAAPLLVDATTGALIVTGGGGGGGSTDMSVTNGILTTTAADTAIIKDEALAIDAKLPALTGGRIPVESANMDSEEFTFTQTGAIAVGTTLISIDAQKFREVVVFATSTGTSGAIGGQISFNGTNWNTLQPVQLNSNSGSLANIVAGPGGVSVFNTYGARYFRLAMTVGATGGTTTISAWASQTVTPKNYSSVAVTGTVQTNGPVPVATSGFSAYHTLISAESTNATSVKTSAGTIGTLTVTNSTASLKWIRLFNKASAPTVGTDTPVLNFQIPPNSMQHINTAFAGIRLNLGIAYAITGGAATEAVTDSTAVGAGDIVLAMTFA
jgi:hypothetical protein